MKTIALVFAVFATLSFSSFGQELMRLNNGKVHLVLIDTIVNDKIYFYHLGLDQNKSEISTSSISSINYNYAKDSLKQYNVPRNLLLNNSIARSTYKNKFLLTKANDMYFYNNKTYRKFKNIKEILNTEEEKKYFNKVKRTSEMMYAGISLTTLSLLAYSIDGRSLLGDCFFHPDCQKNDRGANPYSLITIAGIVTTFYAGKEYKQNKARLIRLFNGDNTYLLDKISYLDFQFKDSGLSICYNFY